MSKKQPVPSDFVSLKCLDDTYDVRVLDAGTWITVADQQSFTKACQIEMAIMQAMVSYRVERNEWETTRYER